MGRPDTADDFPPFWAHDRASERQALVDFLAIVRKRRKRYPGMHIYHYAAYEKSTLLRLAGRYGVGENDVDDLLRNGVLVDLYPWCARAFGSAPRITASSNSSRCTWATSCAPARSPPRPPRSRSTRDTARYATRAAPKRPRSVLKEIEDYNVYDCRSTRRLRDWLMARAIESGVPPRGPQPVRQTGAAVEPADDLERRLLNFAGDGVEERTPEQTAVAMVAAARGLSPARGQTVLVGALRPCQQSRRRVGGQP